MQCFLSALLLSTSSNLDTLTIAISYGMYKIKIPIISTLIIAVITTLGTFLSMSFGNLISTILPPTLSNVLGGLMLVGIGLFFLIQAINATRKASSDNTIFILDKDTSNNINIKKTIPLSFALTINNIGAGIAASISGINIFYSTIFTFLITIISIFLGCSIGRSIFAKFFGKYAPFISSIILIILGLYESII